MNALRLLFGTLTVLPVQPPTSVDRRTAGWAMALAPVVGLALAGLVAGPLLLAEEYADPSPLVAAVLCIGALAVLTRAIHLDGLADTADALGSGRRDAEAVEVARRSDIGPFGVIALLLLLLMQVAALTTCISQGQGVVALTSALLWSRVTVTWLSVRHRSARTDGLGALVAGTVSWLQLTATVAFAAVVTVAVLAIGMGGAEWLDADPTGVLACVVALSAGPLLAAHAVRRFGGITGDVYGASVESTFTAVLLAATLF